MNNFSKSILFISIIISSILGTISFALIDWELFNFGTVGSTKEIVTTAIFYLSGFSLIPKYVTRLREERKSKW